MNIIFIAYSCSPYGGSEEAIGWNIPFSFSKRDNVIVVTKNEHIEVIQKFKTNNDCNIRFYFVDIPKIYKKIFKGPFRSGRLNIWNRRAYKIVKSICLKEKIDVIHQINPIEFRSIGPFYKIKNTKFVIGPLGGGEFMPKSLKSYLTVKEKIIEKVRLFANKWAIIKYKFKKIGNKVDLTYYANNETKEYLKGLKFKNEKILTEIGNSNQIRYESNCDIGDTFNFIVCGRLNYRKGHLLLLDAIKKIPSNYKFKVYILGDGNKKEIIERKIESYKLNDKVQLLGKVPHDEVNMYYRNANVFIMPSLRETGGAVIIEALSNGLPIISGNAFGVKIVCNEKNSLQYPLNGKKIDIINSLAEKMIYAMDHPSMIAEMSKNSIEYSKKYVWEKKVEIYRNDYRLK